MDRQYFVRDYHGTTTIHPVGLAAMIFLGILVLVVPRKYAIWPMILMACFLPQAQRIVVFTMDFNAIRIMVLFGWLRAILRNEVHGLIWNRLDVLIILWAIMRAFAGVVLGGPSILMAQLGRGFDAIGMYFLFRLWMRSWDDLKSAVWGITVIALPVACAFLYESQTRHNLFSIFGGLSPITNERQGRLRCQGAFAHPILAGCFWGSMLPLVAAQLRNQRRALIVIASMGAILIIVYACASSTPVMAVIFGIVGCFLFFLRKRMRVVRWLIVFGFIALALVMNKPVWHLIARINVVSGSTSWHRYKLIDSCINRAEEWFVIGSSRGAAHWGQGLFDVTNDYVVQCLQGGIIQFGLFIAIIAVGFQFVGRIWRSVQHDKEKLWLAWGLGVCLFAHAANFIGVTYFGQIILMWFLTLAMIGSMASLPKRKRVVVKKVRSAPSAPPQPLQQPLQQPPPAPAQPAPVHPQPAAQPNFVFIPVS